MAFTSLVFDALIGELTEEELQCLEIAGSTGSDSRFADQLGGWLHNAGEPEGASHTIDLQWVSTINFNSSSKFNISISGANIFVEFGNLAWPFFLAGRCLGGGVGVERFSQFQLPFF